MLSSHDLPLPPLDKSHSDRGLDMQPAVLDVTASDDDAVVLRTPSHSLPAVGFPSLHSDSPSPHKHHRQHQQTSATAVVMTTGNALQQQQGHHQVVLMKHGGDGSQNGLQASGDGGPECHQQGGFLDVDDDVAMHVDRDPNRWHDVVRIKFDDIFGEPDPEVFSKDNIWTLTNKVFTLSKFWSYRIVSLVLAIPLAAMWGVYFAGMVFCRVWCCVPCLKACEIELQCVRRLNETILRTFAAPFYEAIGRCFYHIRVRVVKTTEDNP